MCIICSIDYAKDGNASLANNLFTYFVSMQTQAFEFFPQIPLLFVGLDLKVSFKFPLRPTLSATRALYPNDNPI